MAHQKEAISSEKIHLLVDTTVTWLAASACSDIIRQGRYGPEQSRVGN